MRKAFYISLLAVMSLAGCQVNEIVEAIPESKSFTAIIEDSFDGAETRTSLDDNGNVRWKQGDQVSIFAGSTVNEQYQVTDASDGKISADFNKVTGSGFVSGGEIDNNVAFYPYASTAEIAMNSSAYVISNIKLPTTQNYAEGSFGNGAFPMAAVTSTTDDMHLKFKNVLGGLKLQLKGTATITSITVTGNNNEILCGAAEVTVSNTSAPTINLTDATAKTVTLDCGEGVQLDAETATPFVIALPPITMEDGFTVVVTDTEGKRMRIKTTKSQTINRSMLLKMPAAMYEGASISRPLTFTSTGLTSISLVKEGAPNAVSLEYSVNGDEWTVYSVGEVISLADGEKVSFRAGANGNNSFGKSYDNYHMFTVTGSGKVAASGSIMSLLGQEESLTIPSSYCFCFLFYNCTKLTSAPELPATTLAEDCYGSMFCGCKSLVRAPDLPATTLKKRCYDAMFLGCTSLTSTPELLATTLAENCYGFMFSGCTKLASAPELPATTLAEKCYQWMFHECTGLTTASDLPATTLAPYCYSYMFYGCTSLTTAPKLPATTLADGCYMMMFHGCSSLTSAPELPATTLARGCYYQMFEECSKLAYAPELPATTLAENCYANMFQSCTKLIRAPELPATTLAPYCYAYMFLACKGLSQAPSLPATILAENCYYEMFVDCTSLSSAPKLPATKMEKECYLEMFRGCKGLSQAPKLPATTLAENCYSGMFYGCTGLDSAPELIATTLALGCYESMFYDCRLLTSAPELPATSLVKNCYREMFWGCMNLNYIKALFTTVPSNTYTYHWVDGVAATGTFVKSKDATWDVTGVNGVPEGWTILTDATVSDPPAGAVDLGIMMTREDGTTYKLYWAKSNLSTSGLCANPEDYGDHYAWGETEPKDNYDWSTYKWCNGSNNTLTKYNNSSSWGTVDNITELQRGEKVGETMDDAARAKLGGKWRMPTDEEWTALRTQCTWVWTSNYNGTGVAGWIVTATNGNSIFLPAAGYRYDTLLYNVGSLGYYWSSSLYTVDPDYAWDVNFRSGNVYRHGGNRSNGRSVRPVSE